jgi:bile acid-coenzyme A ligase
VPDPAHAIATSGATGRPKVVISPGAGVYDPEPLAVSAAEYMHTRGGQIQLIPAPLYHTNGFRISHNSLLEDQQIVVMERFTAERAVGLIERYGINLMTMVPTMLMRVARLPDLASRDLSSLDAVLQGGACCPQWLLRAWFDIVGADHFFVAYGSSEGVGLTITRGDEWLHHPGTVGRGMGTEIRILDEEGNDVPRGEVGEIFMRRLIDNGPTYVYRGAPPAKSTADGFTTVGDLGWLDEDDFLYIADRRSDMIVSGGANIYPAEIEAALSEHPHVVDVAVIGLSDEEWGRRVHALIQPDPLAPPSEADLQSHCRERLTSYKAPKSYEFVDTLPRTDAGKINRSALVAEREPAASSTAGS